MKKILTLMIFAFLTSGLVFAQCPDNANGNSNGRTFNLNYASSALATATFATISSITFPAWGGGTITVPLSGLELANGDTRIRPDLLASNVYGGQSPFTGDVIFNLTDGSIVTCSYVDNAFQGSVLPVELTSFTAKKTEKSILLEWTTESEIDNQFFTVERSVDGREFKQLKDISGNGNSKEQVTYSFEDMRPRSATNYYRLRQVNYDGSESLTEIVTMDFKNTGLALDLYPTLVKEEINFDLTNFDDENVSIEILDATGHAVLTKTAINSNDIITFNLSDLNLSFGMYYARCQSSSKIAVGKFLIRK